MQGNDAVSIHTLDAQSGAGSISQRATQVWPLACLFFLTSIAAVVVTHWQGVVVADNFLSPQALDALYTVATEATIFCTFTKQPALAGDSWVVAR